jgi:hypothetical protein
MVWVSKKEIDFINWVSPPGIMIKKKYIFFLYSSLSSSTQC